MIKATNPYPDNTLLLPPPELDLFSVADRLGLSKTQTISPSVELPPIYQEGDSSQFWLTDLSTNTMTRIQANLVKISDHAYWYFDPKFTPSTTSLEKAVRAYEEIIHPKIIAFWGPEWVAGVDNDPHLTILHAYFDGGAGYFSSLDGYPSYIRQFSNERKMIYINLNALTLATPEHLGTLAHELQHAIHWFHDSSEETWVNEGLSEVARGIAGYGFSSAHNFLVSPSVQLNQWPSDNTLTPPHYGASALFIEYLAQNYGGYENLKTLTEIQGDGIAGIDAYLKELSFDVSFNDVFKNWLVANYLDPLEEYPYHYPDSNVALYPDTKLSIGQSISLTTPQYAGEYVILNTGNTSSLLSFKGDRENHLLPISPLSGEYCWWSNRGDSINSTLTRELDLTLASNPDLSFWMWHSIEENWDYLYLTISANGGTSWSIIETVSTSDINPTGTGFGPGYTGSNKKWKEYSVDLSEYSGKKIQFRFEYITDESVNKEGVCIDEISISELGFFEDAESPSAWIGSGFVRINNILAQNYSIQLVQVNDTIHVTDLTLDENNEGYLIVQPETEDTINLVIVAPITTLTTQHSSYTLSLSDPTADLAHVD
jgi:hypothetical protein